MSTRADHYERLLGPYYTWMSGFPLEVRVAQERGIMDAASALTAYRALAADLSSEPGFQAAALRDLGFRRVVAADLSGTMSGEFRRRLGRGIVLTSTASPSV